MLGVKVTKPSLSWGGGSRFVPALFAAGFVVLAALVLSRVGPLNASFSRPHWVTDALYLGVNLIAAALCLLRAGRYGENRLAWRLIGVGMLCSGAATAYSHLVLRGMIEVPYPSLSDVGWLAFYVLLFAGVMMLLRGRLREARLTLWVDSVLAMLTLAALVAAFVYEPVIAATGGEPRAVVTSLAYPTADAVLLTLAVALLALGGWRLDRASLTLVGAICLQAVGDVMYVREVALGTYVPGGLLDAVFPGAMMLIAVAAWAPSSRDREVLDLQSWSMLVAPGACTMVAVSLLAYGNFEKLSRPALALASLALVSSLLRLAFGFRHHRALGELARTDPLTGLLNEREYHAALALHLRRADEREAAFRFSIALIGLDDLRALNDRKGHVEADRVLQAVARVIEAKCRSADVPARLGGGAFALLLPRTDGEEAAQVAERVVTRIAGLGEGVGASYGIAEWPTDGPGKEMLLLRAEVALYSARDQARKSERSGAPLVPQSDSLLNPAGRPRFAQPRAFSANRRPSRHREIPNGQPPQPSVNELLEASHASTVLALTATVAAKDDYTGGHLQRVHDLGLLLAREMIPDEADDPQLAYGFLLHDIGKVAVPDSILQKPGRLNEQEWELMRRHPRTGVDILAPVSFLRRAVEVVLHHHERWDGRGYPDGLSGADIPVWARIFSIVDTVDAITTDRPYRRGMSLAVAMAELANGSGSHFDPSAVKAFKRLDPVELGAAMTAAGNTRRAALAPAGAR